MSQVHDQIARGGLAVQDEDIRRALAPYADYLIQCSDYPDRVDEVRAKLPREVRFLWPDPPRTAWQRRLERMSRSPFWSWCGQPPLNSVYLCRPYIENAVRSIERGDLRSAAAYCAVYSHVIADVIEPGHAVFDWALDLFAPAPACGVYTNKECLRGPVDIAGYRPQLLGETLRRAEMRAMADLVDGSRFAAALAGPIEQAIYAGDFEKARRLHSKAQNESARRFADFLRTVFHLAWQGSSRPAGRLDLCTLPFAAAEVSCYCRFRPLVDVFLDPACFGGPGEDRIVLRPLPLALRAKGGRGTETVHGLCVLPAGMEKEATVDYLLASGAYDTFSACVGLHPAYREALGPLRAVFTVRGEGGERARSRPVRAGDPPVRIEAALGRTRILTLAMSFRGPFSRRHLEAFRRAQSAAHGVWAEPVLSGIGGERRAAGSLPGTGLSGRSDYP